MPTLVKKIIICEDHQIVIDGLLSIFKNEKSFLVIDYVTSASDLFNSIEKSIPHIVLLDLNLPGKNGMEILIEMKEKFSDIKIIILTMYNKPSVINEVMRNGANGFLLKNCSTEDLLDALKHIYESDQFYLGEGVKKINDTTLSDFEDNFYKKIKITRREKEIISELIRGCKVPQIAEKLFISTHTVETHKKNIFRKLNIKSSIDLIQFVNENRLF